MDLRAVSANLGAVVLERVSAQRFVRASHAPSWWHTRIEGDDPLAPIEICDVFPFLESFLPTAERAWSSVDSPPIASDMWTESATDGDFHLYAIAVRTGDAEVLVITRNDQMFHEHQLLLQRARELRMTYDAFMREIERKDILLHTIVHDLTAPLHSIVGSLSLLRECSLPASAMRWTELAVEAAARQRQLITGILDVFVTEQGSAPELVEVDLRGAIEKAVAEREPIARQRQVDLVATIHSCAAVRAEKTRLLRVLTNLLDNAIRHSPPEGRVAVTCTLEDGTLRICIEDDGPGVAPEILPHLFDKLVHDPRGGGTGLGLYFCRITIEQWGGGIGYEARASGGARFWIRLPAVVSAAADVTRSEGHGEVASAR